MCLITFAYRVHPEFPLILAANRDEFFDRPTAPAHDWGSHPGLIAGKDLRAGGTWMGLRVAEPGAGRLAGLTNIREIPEPPHGGRSRGELVTDALLKPEPLPAILAAQSANGHHYRGFNILAADAGGMYYGSNRSNGVKALPPGRYGLSNGTLDEPWPKVQRACAAMDAFVAEPGALETLVSLLHNPQVAPDEQLPDTGIGYDKEKGLSAEFIRMPEFNYGTRASTAIMIDRRGTAHMLEQNFDGKGKPTSQTRWELPGFW